MTITVSSGATSSGLVIADGGELIVDAGGHIRVCKILSGGSAFVSSGGFSTGTFVYGHASAVVEGDPPAVSP
jgi:autotransporter passenger strand-loop-strand repeat protein